MGNCAERDQFGVKCRCIVCIHGGFVQEVWLFVFHQNPATAGQLQEQKGSSILARWPLRALYLSHFPFRGRVWPAGSRSTTQANTSVNLSSLRNHAAITALKNFSRLQFAFLIRSIYMQMRLCAVHHCDAMFSTSSRCEQPPTMFPEMVPYSGQGWSFCFFQSTTTGSGD